MVPYFQKNINSIDAIIVSRISFVSVSGSDSYFNYLDQSLFEYIIKFGSNMKYSYI